MHFLDVTYNNYRQNQYAIHVYLHLVALMLNAKLLEILHHVHVPLTILAHHQTVDQNVLVIMNVLIILPA